MHESSTGFNIKLNLTNSLYSININNASSYNAYSGLLAIFNDQFQFGWTTPLIAITNSSLYNLKIGIYIFLNTLLAFSSNQCILIKSCTIYNNSKYGLFTEALYRSPTIQTSVKNISKNMK